MSRAIRQLLLSQAVANIADIFFRVVVIANVFLLSGSVLASSLVPILIGLSSFVASFLVPLVTRWMSLHRVLFWTQLGKTVLLALLVLLLFQLGTVSLLVLYGIIILISLLDGFAAPVSYAIIPRYATDLAKSNAALSMSGEIIQLIGWGLGGLLFASWGLVPSMFLVLACYLLSSGVMWTLPAVEKETLAGESSWGSLTRGWRLVMKEEALKRFVQINLLEILANTVWVSSILLVFVTNILHQTETYWGYSNTAYSLGILAGGALVFRWSERVTTYKWQSIAFSLLAMALATSLLLVFPDPWIFLLLTALTGLLSQIKEVPESVFLQESVKERDLVAVYSVLEVLSTLAFSGFVFLMSFVTEMFGVQVGFLFSAICLLVETFIVVKARRLFE